MFYIRNVDWSEVKLGFNMPIQYYNFFLLDFS